MVLYLTLSHIEPLPSSLVILLAMRFTCIAACSCGRPTAPSVEGATATWRSSTHGVEQRRTSCKGQQESHPEVRVMSYIQLFPPVFPYWFRWFHMILQCSTHFMSILFYIYISNSHKMKPESRSQSVDYNASSSLTKDSANFGSFLKSSATNLGSG